jgi:uracil phosphoribosyltransferase
MVHSSRGSKPVSFRMLGTQIADSHNLVCDGMLTVGGASVDAVDVVDTAADGVSLDDPDTHVDWLGVVGLGQVA